MAANVICRRVRALAAVTVFVAGYGQVIMDPDSRDENKREPFVPESKIDQLVREGRIADDLGSDPLDHDGDGKPGGSTAPEGDVSGLRALYKEVTGKNPFPGWDAAELQRRIDLADQAPA